MRANGFAERLPYSGVFWAARSLARRDTGTMHLFRPIAEAISLDSHLADLCLDGAEDWLKQLRAAGTQTASRQPEFWWLWDLLAAVEREVVRGTEGDERPYDTALNAGGGSLAEVLMSEEGRLGGPAGRGLSEEHLARFDRIAVDSGVIGVHGRVLLVMQLHWLHAIDPGWTERNLLPRFDWNWPDQDETICLWWDLRFSSSIGPDAPHQAQTRVARGPATPRGTRPGHPRTPLLVSGHHRHRCSFNVGSWTNRRGAPRYWCRWLRPNLPRHSAEAT